MTLSPTSHRSDSTPSRIDVWSDVQAIRRRSPLVLNITIFVVMNLTANALLAVGASPVMAHAPEELDEMIAPSQSLVINIGTLSREWIEAMDHAVIAAGRRRIPVVIDPVGSGATRFRTETARRLLSLASPAILRANASEVRSLAGSTGNTKGVDSVNQSIDAIDAAEWLVKEFWGAVSISGRADIILDFNGRIGVQNGSELMASVTRMGCTASALTGAFAAIHPSTFSAAAHAMALMGVAGERAAETCTNPGTFVPHFLDALDNLGEATLDSGLNLTATFLDPE